MINKTLFKKLNTWFWWILAFLPFIILIVYYLGWIKSCENLSISNWSDFISYAQENYLFMFDDLLDNGVGQFGMSDLCIPFITDSINSIFNLFDIEDNYFNFIFSWFVSINVYRLLIDLIIYFINFIENFVGGFKRD